MKNNLDNQSKEFLDLYDKKSELNKKIDNNKKRLREDEELLNNQNLKLQKLCNHKWVYEPPEYHTRSYTYCSICFKYK